MYWNKPYRTGEYEKREVVIGNAPGRQTIEVPMERLGAGIGDLVYEYAKRANCPWWLRWIRYPIARVELQSIREKLNAMSVEWYE